MVLCNQLIPGPHLLATGSASCLYLVHLSQSAMSTESESRFFYSAWALGGSPLPCANSVSVFWLCAIPFLVVGEQRMRYPKIRFFCIWVTLGDNYLEKLKYTSKQIWRNEPISATGHKDRILNFRLWVLLFFKIKSVGEKPRQEKTGKNITIKQRWGVSCTLPFTPSLVVKSLSS